MANELDFVIDHGTGSADITVDGRTAQISLSAETYKGDPGLSAYQVAVNNGFRGSQAEWLASLKGATGDASKVTATKRNGVTTLTVTDNDGTHTTQILDGADGTDGTDGVDGVSPTVGVSKSGKVTTLTITDKDGSKTAAIADGTDGTNGTNGVDGVSPTIGVSKVGKITTLTITDKDGTKTATVSDGADGEGSGDMMTFVYDADADGVVDIANGLTAEGKQSVLTGVAMQEDIPDISGLATKEQIPDISGFATKDQIPDVSNFATKDQIPDVSQFEKAVVFDVTIPSGSASVIVASDPRIDPYTRVVYFEPASWQAFDTDATLTTRASADIQLTGTRNASTTARIVVLIHGDGG